MLISDRDPLWMKILMTALASFTATALTFTSVMDLTSGRETFGLVTLVLALFFSWFTLRNYQVLRGDTTSRLGSPS